MDGRGKLVLPPVQIPAAAARPLCGQSRTSSARKAAATRCVRFVEGGLKDLSISRTSFDWGVPVPGSDRPRHVRLARCADQLHHRPRLSRRHRAVAPLLAGRRPSDRQGRRALPRGLLAGLPDVARGSRCRSRSTATASCSAAARRCRRASAMSSTRWCWPSASGSMRCAISCCAKCTFGQDGSYSAEAIVARANAELANSFGNLAQRTLSMIVKNLDGVLPAARRSDADDANCSTLVRRTVGEEVPEAFERFAFSVGIEAWMQAVFACNAYVDAQAPWALRKTDPERMAAVLGTLVVGRSRSGASRSRRSFPASADKLLDPASTPAEGGGADSRSRRRCSRGSSCRGRGSGSVRLIDSHCHLNYEGLVERQDEVLEMPRERGVAGFLNISTRQREWDEIIAVAEREPRRLGQRRRPPARGRRASRSRRGGAGRRRRPSARDRHRRVRPRLLLRQVRPRTRSASASRRISRRRGRPACRSSSTRATPRSDTAEILTRGGEGGGRHRRAPLLHRLGRARAQGPRPRLLRLAVGHRDLQERRRTCRRPPSGCPPTRCWSRPIRPSSRRSRTAGRSASRPLSPIPRLSSPS